MHPCIGKDWNQSQVPSGCSLHVSSLLPPAYLFSLCLFLFFACSLFISFFCWSNSITENEGNWELPSLRDTSPVAWRETESIFGVSRVWLLFSQGPRVSCQAPGRLCSALLISQDSVFLLCFPRPPHLKSHPRPAYSNALATNLKAASPQDAETSLGPSAHLQKGEKHSPHRRQISSLSPGDIYSAQVYTTQSTNGIWAHMIFEWFWSPSFFPILEINIKYPVCILCFRQILRGPTRRGNKSWGLWENPSKDRAGDTHIRAACLLRLMLGDSLTPFSSAAF